jgi:hypothetical protein
MLLVEDSPGDVRLTREALKDAKMHINLHVASDRINSAPAAVCITCTAAAELASVLFNETRKLVSK